MADTQFSVTTSPHLRTTVTVSSAMRDVLYALAPITLVSIYWFKFNAVFLIAVCLIVAMLTELLFRKAMNKPATLKDGSALVTGLLVALCSGGCSAWWVGALATFIAVGIAKELMGGLGWNRFNPAAFGRISVFLLTPFFYWLGLAFSPLQASFGGLDVITSATPLALLKQGTALPDLGSLFLSFPGGALGETSALALLIGGAYLLYKEHIRWHIPVSIVAGVFVMALLFGDHSTTPFYLTPFYHIFSGGVLLGALFMATDWVTSPITPRGRVIFGLAIGILLMIFRLALGPTEGTCFSILIMNAFVPLIDRLTRQRKFGEAPARPAPVAVKPSLEKSS
ncbi:MAG: RnfABCDGE type electron transport complex subunit D [Firmicutes bacterium]|nr:RnfABCDGE type electron transport complex subunit D [Bacillota bacterium]